MQTPWLGWVIQVSQKIDQILSRVKHVARWYHVTNGFIKTIFEQARGKGPEI